MKVLVLGGGVIGVTTAYYLMKAGHDVEVLERRDAPAAETSFANAGQISPGYASPWAAPGMPFKALKWLAMKHGPLVVRPRADLAMWSWLIQALFNCTKDRYAINKARMVPIAEYSRDCLRDLRSETGISYDERSHGTLQLFRTQQQLDGVGQDIDVLKQFDVPFEILDREGCISVEPALTHASANYVGGLRLPQDETGDCHTFTKSLAGFAAAQGVRFSYNTECYQIVADGRAVTRVNTSCGSRAADAYVVALGSYSPLVVKPLGLRLPIYPVKGYSLTIPLNDPTMAPVSTIMDETYKTAITRLGDRIRVGGTAELGGFDMSLRKPRRKTLAHSVNELFPHGGDLDAAIFWCGLRPMTLTARLSSAEVQFAIFISIQDTAHLVGLWLCGSGRVIADLIDGKSPHIDPTGLSLSRFF